MKLAKDRKNMHSIVVFLLISVSVTCFSCPVRAGDVMIKIANITDRFMNKYSRTEGNFLKQGEVFFDGLEQILNVKGVILRDEGDLNRGFVLNKNLKEARSEIKNMFPFKCKLTGRQMPSDNSGWDKLIICSMREDSMGYFILEVGEGASRYKAVSEIAVKNEGGRLERWRISEGFPKGEEKTVYRVAQEYFMHQMRQGNFVKWFQNIVSKRNGIGMLIVEKNDEQDEESDAVLVWVNLEDVLKNGNGLSEAVIVVGWQRP